MFEIVDGRTDDGLQTDAGVTGILLAHPSAFGSGELKIIIFRVYGWRFTLATTTLAALSAACSVQSSR